MTISIETAAIQRAKAALDIQPSKNNHAVKSAFLNVCRVLLSAEDNAAAWRELAQSPHEAIQKAAVHDYSGLAGADSLSALGQAFVSSYGERDLLSVLQQTGQTLPALNRRHMVASGFIADPHSEAAAIDLSDNILHLDSDQVTTVAGIVAMSKELALTGGPEFGRILEHELQKALIRGCNDLVLQELLAIAGSSTGGVTGTGNLLNDIQSAIDQLEQPGPIVIAGNPNVCARLAMSTLNHEGAGVEGGELVKGLHVVAVSSPVLSTFVIAPAELGIYAGAIDLQKAEHATVSINGTETGLFQSGLTAVKAMRTFGIVGRVNIVEIA